MRILYKKGQVFDSKDPESLRSRAGEVRLEPSEPDDIYQCYNLIAAGDTITASTTRNVQREGGSGSSKTKLKMNVSIVVEKGGIVFDEATCSLQLNGKNCKENEYIKIGQFHKIDLSIDEPFILQKEEWDQMSLDLLEEVAVPTRKADTAVIVMQEGIANICLVSSVLTHHKAAIEHNIPKKTMFDNKRDKSLDAFFQKVYTNMMRVINFELVQVVLVASPGFLNRDFIDYSMKRADRDGSALLKEKQKFITCYSTSGHVSSITRIISEYIQRIQFKEDKGNNNSSGGGGSSNGRNQDLGNLIMDTKFSDNIKALDNFTAMLSADENKISYGKKRVFAAADLHAIDSLLISDVFFRDPNPVSRNQWRDLINLVKQNGGKVFKMSSQHPSGKQLNNYSGVAAILRHPIYEHADDSGESQMSVPEYNIRPKVVGATKDNTKSLHKLEYKKMDVSELEKLCKDKKLSIANLCGKNDLVQLLLENISYQAGDKIECNFQDSTKWLPATISRDRCDKTYDIVYDEPIALSSRPGGGGSSSTHSVGDAESSEDEFESDEDDDKDEGRQDLEEDNYDGRASNQRGDGKFQLTEAALWDLESFL